MSEAEVIVYVCMAFVIGYSLGWAKGAGVA